MPVYNKILQGFILKIAWYHMSVSTHDAKITSIMTRYYDPRIHDVMQHMIIIYMDTNGNYQNEQRNEHVIF